MDWSRKGKGAAVPLAEAVKKQVSIPVFCSCRLDPALGEKLNVSITQLLFSFWCGICLGLSMLSNWQSRYEVVIAQAFSHVVDMGPIHIIEVRCCYVDITRLPIFPGQGHSLNLDDFLW